MAGKNTGDVGEQEVINPIMTKLLTLCVVLEGDQIILGMKKRGFGVGHWNGFGGKVEEGEDVPSAAKRELKEEINIEAEEIEPAGILHFSFLNDPKILEVHVFKVTKFSGTPTESEEMRPQKFSFAEIPYDEMWSDDKYWLPILLAGKLFKGSFLFDKPSSAEYSAKIISQELTEVPHL